MLNRTRDERIDMKYIIVLVLLFSSIYADRDGGPYIGLGYGLSQFNDDGVYDTFKNDKSNAAGFYLGAYINKHLSVEFNYADFTAYESTVGYEVSDTENLRFYFKNFSTLAHYAFFDDLWDFYAKVGVGEVTQGALDIEGFSYVLGLGTSIRLSEMISIKLAYDRYSFGLDNNNDNSSDNDLSIDYIYTALEFQF